MVASVSVDGLAGSLIARSRGLNRGVAATDQALVRFGNVSRNGQRGTNARQAVPGSPAGLLAVVLTESAASRGGIHVGVITFESRQEPPGPFDVPIRQDVLFSAVGGAGEAGQLGSDGQRGANGDDGAPATRVTDATAGTDGGDGGDAGSGSSGGDGGAGGNIQVLLDENNTHLLMAVKCDVRGGEGGVPGRHGRPGDGGTGGRGGAGHKWRERVGYTYHCTSNCIGTVQSNTSTALVRIGSHLETGRALTSGIRAQAIQGGNLQAVIAQLAAQYNARQRPTVDPGACRCRGGQGNCVGCVPQPVHKDFQRAAGLNGNDGRPGAPATIPLIAGATGAHGNATFHVQQANGNIQEYTSCYRLELVDFDIDDENQDGIFEPGEHLFIRRIRVRNTGGMPSPTRPIPITVVPSDWLIPVDGDEGHTFLPPSIPDGNTVTLDGSIKVLIRSHRQPPVAGAVFHQSCSIAIRATMPWLDRALPYFEHTREFEIQYPCELRNINSLSSVAQGSISQLTFEVFNKCNKDMGSEATSPRAINIIAAIPAEHGTLHTTAGDWNDNIARDVALVPPLAHQEIQQTIRILPDAESYQHSNVVVDLYIATPGQRNEHGGEEELEEVIPIQRVEIRMQISSHYTFNPRSSFLLVTNSETTRARSQALQVFFSETLGVEVDTWNIDLYGGLKYQGEHGTAARDIVSAYHGKSIVFLGNNFQFFKSGNRTAVDLCDGQCLAEAAMKGTSLLVLGSSETNGFSDLVKTGVLHLAQDLPHTQSALTQSKKFTSASELIKAVGQERQVGTRSLAVYSVPVRDRWYYFGKAKAKSEARRQVKYLRKHIPHERFTVTYMAQQDDSTADLSLSDLLESNEKVRGDGLDLRRQIKSKLAWNKKEGEEVNLGVVLISKGLPHEAFLVETERQAISESESTSSRRATNNMPAPGGLRLDRFESYIIIASLPSKDRIDMIWRAPVQDHRTDDQSFPARASAHSVLSDIETEIRIFLRRSACLDSLVKRSPKALPREERIRIFTTHLPTSASLLNHRQTTGTLPPPTIVLDIFRYAIASTRPQKKRQIAREVLLPVYNRSRRLHRLFVAEIDHILTTYKSFTAEELKEFRKAAGGSHSRFDRSKRNVSRIIVRQGAELTGKSEHGFERGMVKGSDVVPKTVYCDPGEWNARVRRNAEKKARIEGEMEEAREALGRMILASGA